MNYEVLYRPSYSLLRVELDRDESLRAEPGAMVGMSAGIRVQTQMRGGLFGAVRRVLGGESLFLNTFSADQAGEITLAPPLPGDITALELTGDPWIAQSGAFLAAGEGVELDAAWGGARAFFAGEKLIMLRLSGQGLAFLSSYGAIHPVSLETGQEYTVDTGHLVAFPEGLDYQVRAIGGLKSTLLGGEGLVCRLRGPGTVYIQTRSEESFLSWLIPHLPTRSE